MASKNQKIVTKGKSAAYLNSNANAAKKRVTEDAKKLTAANKVLASAQKQVNEAQSALSKVSGYKDTSNTYNSLVAQINALKKKKSASKSKKTRGKYDSEIKKLSSQRITVAARLRSMVKSAGYDKYQTQLTRASTTLANTKKQAANLTSKKATDTHAYNVYISAYNQTSEAKNKKLQRKNSTKIQKSIQKSKKPDGKVRGFTTAVYRADLKSGQVFLLGEVSPTETNEQNLPTHPVDSSDPRLNYGNTNSKQLSGTYYLHGNSFSSLDSQYATLLSWSSHNYRLCIRGFTRWSHAYLSSVGKSMEEPYKDTLALQLTFQFADQAKIKFIKATKKKSKPKAVKKTGTHKSKAKYIKIKAGMTYWGIGQKYHVSVSWLESHNKWPARVIPIGVKVRYA